MATYRVPVLDDFSWQPPVKDKELTAPPGGETKGDRYIVGGSATGAWAGLDNHIVTYDGAAWIDATPAEGWYVYIEDENVLYHYTGAAWDADDVSSLEGDITSIDTRITNVESSVGSIDTNLTNTDSSVGSINTVVSTNVVGISTNVANISTNTAGISTNVVAIDNVESSVGSINTQVTNVESSVGSINTLATANASTLLIQSAGISTNVVAIDNVESSVGSINTAKQDKGTYVSAYGAIEFSI